jgi:hypothetical protein
MRSIALGVIPTGTIMRPESVSNTLQSRDRKPASAAPVLFSGRLLIFSHPLERHIQLSPKDLAAGRNCVTLSSEIASYYSKDYK